MYKLFALCLTFFALKSTGQTPYFQQKLNYKINVALNDVDKTLKGDETIVYKNNSNSQLEFIWFHIYPNAYKNETTAMFQQIKNDPSRKKKLEKYSLGNIEGLNFKVNGTVASVEAHPNPQFIDVIKVNLPSPLKAGDSVIITTDFKVKLPSYFSRSGYVDEEFIITQWYPKPAVFDKDGWHEFPYLDMGEFYSEYADYNVNITLPSAYVVGATGILQNEDELNQYKTTGAKNFASKNDKPALYVPKDKNGTKTLSYVMKNVPDFAWFADKKYVISYDTLKLTNGNVVDVFTYYYNKKNTLWLQSVNYAKDAVSKYSSWIGAYEYPIVQVVEGPENNASGGMEYPTITLITSPDAKAASLDAVITHEVGHNWFMSILGSNERANTWQDEGLNTYYQFRYEAEKYRANSIFGDALPEKVKALPVDQFQATVYNAMSNGIPMNSAIATSLEKFADSDDYAMTSYIKTALWMYLLEASVGRNEVDKAFQTYYNDWKNKHPSPKDMKASFEKSLGKNLDQFFELLNQKGSFK